MRSTWIFAVDRLIPRMVPISGWDFPSAIQCAIWVPFGTGFAFDLAQGGSVEDGRRRGGGFLVFVQR